MYDLILNSLTSWTVHMQVFVTRESNTGELFYEVWQCSCSLIHIGSQFQTLDTIPFTVLCPISFPYITHIFTYTLFYSLHCVRRYCISLSDKVLSTYLVRQSLLKLYLNSSNWLDLIAKYFLLSHIPPLITTDYQINCCFWSGFTASPLLITNDLSDKLMPLIRITASPLLIIRTEWSV